MKILIVVDMQNDFLTGSLGSDRAKAIVPNVVKKVKDFCYYGDIFFTQDTHGENYLDTMEGKYLPIKHCIIGTDGYKIIKELERFADLKAKDVFIKNSFGMIEIANTLNYLYEFADDKIESIELVGIATSICVLSNAIILKAAFPEVPIIVDASCCACITEDSHKIAIEAMKMCQIDIIGE